MQTPPRITSPYAPDIGEVRVFLEKMIRALRFVELVTAIVAFVSRVCEVNGELTNVDIAKTPMVRDPWKNDNPPTN